MEAQLKLGIPSIGYTYIYSGSFEDIDVPPTLVSFAVAMTKASKTISTEFKNAGSKVIYVPVPENKAALMPDWDKLIEMYKAVYALCDEGKVLSASVVKEGGRGCKRVQGLFRQRLRIKFAKVFTNDELFAPLSGSLVIELADGAELDDSVLSYDLGVITDDGKLHRAKRAWRSMKSLKNGALRLKRYSRQKQNARKLMLMQNYIQKEIQKHLQ